MFVGCAFYFVVGLCADVFFDLLCFWFDAAVVGFRRGLWVFVALGGVASLCMFCLVVFSMFLRGRFFSKNMFTTCCTCGNIFDQGPNTTRTPRKGAPKPVLFLNFRACACPSVLKVSQTKSMFNRCQVAVEFRIRACLDLFGLWFSFFFDICKMCKHKQTYLILSDMCKPARTCSNFERFRRTCANILRCLQTCWNSYENYQF